MSRVLGIMLVFLLVLAATGGDGGQNRPATPAEQFKALVREFHDAAQVLSSKAKTDEERNHSIERIEKASLRLLELAEKNPKDPVAVDALAEAITTELHREGNTSKPAWSKDSAGGTAMAILLRDHVKSEKLGDACRLLRYSFSKEAEAFLRTVLDKSPRKDVQAQVSVHLAQFLKARLHNLELIKEQPEMAQRYRDRYGKEYLTALHQQDLAKAMAEVENLLESAIERSVGGTVGEQAKTVLFEIRHLAVGKQAMDIDGHDQDGKRFKLSAYRGKVVLLYFWSEY